MELKKGTKVRVIHNRDSLHCFEIGARLTIVEQSAHFPHGWRCRKWLFGMRQILTEDEFTICK